MKKRILMVAALAGIMILAVGLMASGQIPGAVARELPPVAGSERTTTNLGQTMVIVEPVKREAIDDVLRLNGRLAFNAMRVQLVSSRVAGRIEKIMVFEGAAVRAGEPVALLYSPEYVSAQNEFLLARNTVRLLGGKSTADLLEDAKVTLESARNRLRVLGVSEGDIATLDQSGLIQQHLVIRAPISGRLIKRNVDPGGYLDTGTSLGTVADLSELWFQGNAYEADLARLREGQAVQLSVAGLPGQRVPARISFISPTIDPQTHTAQVRVDVLNRNGQFKPDMFAQAEIAVGQLRLPVVPRAAVVQDGADSFVIVQRGENRFERVPVRVAPTINESRLAVVSGLQEGDRVVMEGGVLVERSLPRPSPEKSLEHKSGYGKGTGT